MSDDIHVERVHERFARTAERVAERERERREELRGKVREFVPLTGEERVLDSGAGTGALAFALAPLVREVVALDIVPELLDLGRKAAAEFPNVTFLEGDATRLPFDPGSFDLACCHRTLHHVARPELAVSELARVTSLGGRVLIVDQIAPADPLAALELDRFEQEPRDLDRYLDLAGCEGPAREAALAAAPTQLVASVGWYLAAKPVP